MATTFIEDGTDSTQDLTFYAVVQGTVTSATDQQHTGPCSLKLNTNNPSANVQVATVGGILADAGRRISMWIRRSALPSADEQFIFPANASGQACFGLRLANNGVIKINNGTGTTLATGTAVLSLNTWYRVTLSYILTSTTVYSIKVYVNGTLDSSVSNSTALPRVGSNKLEFSQVGAIEAINSLMWIDDIYIDDSSALTDPGDIRVTSKRPNANGTTNGFTTQIGSGGSGYGSGHSPQVNEQPLSTTNGWSMIGAGSAITEEYNIENAATGDVNITGLTIVDYMGWVYTSSLAGETGSIIVNGVSSSISITSSNTLFFKVAGSSTYPAGTGTDIGEITDTSLTTVSLYECGILIAYNPAISNTPLRTLLGVGI